MTAPVTQPGPAPARPRRPWLPWVSVVVLLLALSGAAAAGYQLGQRYRPAPVWDPLWVRAYVNRPADQAPPSEGFWVTGYYVTYDRDSLDVVAAHSRHMDQVIVFGYGFDRSGRVTGDDPWLIRGVTGPQKRVLVFGNLTDGSFDADTAHAILTDSTVQERAIQGMLDKVAQLGAAGVQIDFEEIPSGDRDAYTAFLRRLKEALRPAGVTLSVAVAAKTSDTTTGWGGATDYAAVGQIVDQVYLMTYDQHWRGGEPGPIASLPWTERVVRYAVGVIPAQKIVLGVPFYGYEWAVGPGADPKTNRAYGAYRLQQRAAEHGAQVTWDPALGENTATYQTQEGQRVAWWPDERSLQAKLQLAYQYNLRGIAIWRLGFEPEHWWEVIAAFRVNPTK
jgi:spore germination protein